MRWILAGAVVLGGLGVVIVVVGLLLPRVESLPDRNGMLVWRESGATGPLTMGTTVEVFGHEDTARTCLEGLEIRMDEGPTAGREA